MKVKLIIKKQRDGKHFKSVLTHIKVIDNEGKHVKFAKHSDEILEYLHNIQINISDNITI